MLKADEITAGCVAYLDGDQLLRDDRVASGDHGKIGQRRPFVCVRVSADRSEWMLLTKQKNRLRVNLDKWKQPGSDFWMNTEQNLHDARKVFSGPSQAFVDASADEINHHPRNRPSISNEGVERIQKEIRRYKPDW